MATTDSPLTVLHFVPNEGLFLKQVPRSLESYQSLVGGLIEIVPLLDSPTLRVDVTVNEEGMYTSDSVGWVWPCGPNLMQPIFGSFFVCRSRADPEAGWVYESIDPIDVQYVCKLFATKVGPL